MVGYPGSGKTTVSRMICDMTGAVHLWADHIRNQRFPNPTHSHEENLALYGALNQEAEDLLAAGNSVVYDTNFNFYKDRKKLKIIAAKAGARTVVIWMTTPKAVAKERATQHGGAGGTRVWAAMPEDRFEQIASHLEPPTPDEQPICFNGTTLGAETVATVLREKGLAPEA